jgi:hypothetical protein
MGELILNVTAMGLGMHPLRENLGLAVGSAVPA